MKRITIIAACVIGHISLMQAQPMRLKQLANQKDTAWFATQEALAAADSVVKYQFPSGGWAKNVDWHIPAEGNSLKARQEVWRQMHSQDGVGSTIDNGATTTELKLLARVCRALNAMPHPSKDERRRLKTYREVFHKGFNYLLTAQYANGGWPQYYPFKPQNKEGHAFYSNHITFNDNAMANVMHLLEDVSQGNEPFDGGLQLTDKDKERAHEAFMRGIQCILDCQIKKDGKLTVWCQQHDELTLQPAPARAYELPSFTGSHETPALLSLLMSLKHPSDSVITAVTAAVEWLKDHALRDVKLESFTNAEGKRDRRLVHHFGSTTWARYYDLQTEEPYVCDRDGVPQPSLEYIGYERRNGYGWYGTEPQKIINKFSTWIKKVQRD
ncbi:MAG: pectate lyase [Prevotella sp.]|nr:pectate lyase [Prevotella sp.]